MDVDEYEDERGLRRNSPFQHVLQALIELSGEGSEKRTVLESISNHLGLKGAHAPSLFE